MANTVTNKKLLAEHSALKNVLLYSVHLDSFKLIYTPKLRERQKSLSVSIKKFMSANSGSFVAIVGPHNDMLEKKFEKDPQVTFQIPRVLRFVITLAFAVGMIILHNVLFVAAKPLSQPKVAAKVFCGLGPLLLKSVRGFSEYRIYKL